MSFYRRRLPHWEPQGAFFFLTWRLAGSMPVFQPILRAPRAAGAQFVELDRQLGRAACGPAWLRDPRLAVLVTETLRAGERERNYYHLRAWVVMPNHVHVLLRPTQPLRIITRWVKGSTARRANLLLGRAGQPFWQDESWDRWVRTEQELGHLVRYIEHNPVYAGLVATPGQWPWSSASLAGVTACPTISHSKAVCETGR
jgi:putative transposase